MQNRVLSTQNEGEKVVVRETEGNGYKETHGGVCLYCKKASWQEDIKGESFDSVSKKSVIKL